MSGRRFAFPKGMGLRATLSSLIATLLIFGISVDAHAKELNCVVFADFQNPEDQAFLSSKKVLSKKHCLRLAQEWTSARCFRYAGYGYLLTVIFDDTESLQKDEVRGPVLKQCPRTDP